jgi:hypothetical protein
VKWRRAPFNPYQPSFDGWESIAVLLNFLMVGVLLLTVLRKPRNVAMVLLSVLSVVSLVKFVTAAILLRSWALLLWVNSEAVFGILLGTVILFIVSRLSRAGVILIGSAVAITYLVVVNVVFPGNDPAAAMTIYHWHYKHLLNYNGLAQTIALTFPILLLCYLWRVRKV